MKEIEGDSLTKIENLVIEMQTHFHPKPIFCNTTKIKFQFFILLQAMLESFWKIFSWIWDANFGRISGSPGLEEISLKNLLDPSGGNSDFDKKDLSFSLVSLAKLKENKRFG